MQFVVGKSYRIFSIKLHLDRIQWRMTVRVFGTSAKNLHQFIIFIFVDNCQYPWWNFCINCKLEIIDIFFFDYQRFEFQSVFFGVFAKIQCCLYSCAVYLKLSRNLRLVRKFIIPQSLLFLKIRHLHELTYHNRLYPTHTSVNIKCLKSKLFLFLSQE